MYMKFFRIVPILCAVLLVAALATFSAFAEDLPPPMGEGDSPNFSEPAPQPALPSDGNLADEGALPEPGAGPQEGAGNQVNTQAPEDDVFLPAPSGPGNYNDVAIPTSPTVGGGVSQYEASDWESAMSKRPIFSLYLGIAQRSYPDSSVPLLDPNGGSTGQSKILDPVRGYNVGASIRVLNLGQTIFLHVYGSASFFKLGDVGNYEGIKDFTLNYGPMVEIGLGRRISIFGSLLQRSNNLTGGLLAGRGTEPTHLNGIGEDSTVRPGLGLQYDFHVIPYGSMGLHAHAEPNLIYLTLAFSMEPAPRRRMQLNFDGN